MMTVAHTEKVNATLEEVRRAVLTPEAYQENTKVGQLEVMEEGENWLVGRIHGHLGPVRSSIVARYDIGARRVTLTMVRDQRESADVQGMRGRVTAMLRRIGLQGFTATFDMEGPDGAVNLTHRENYDFGKLSPLLDRALRRWAQGTVVAEVRSLKHWAEAGLGA